MLELIINELTFSAAHYIPGHPKCGGIHGHTYFIRNLTISMPGSLLSYIDKMGIVVDFGTIKDYFKKEWDHKFIIPADDIDYWDHIYHQTGHVPVLDNLKPIDFTTVEWMAAEIQKDLISLCMEQTGLATDFSEGVPDVHFEICEGPGQGMKL